MADPCVPPFDTQGVALVDGNLRLTGQESMLSRHRIALVARRLQSLNARFVTALNYEPDDFQQMAGVSAYYDSRNWVYLRISCDETLGKTLNIVSCENGQSREHVSPEVSIVGTETVHLAVVYSGASFHFEYSPDGQQWQSIGEPFSAGLLSDEHCGGLSFTGTFLALTCQDLSGTPSERRLSVCRVHRSLSRPFFFGAFFLEARMKKSIPAALANITFVLSLSACNTSQASTPTGSEPSTLLAGGAEGLSAQAVNWFAKQPSENVWADRLQSFMAQQGTDTFSNVYTLTGTPHDTHHDTGHIAMLATTGLAATNARAYAFTEALWNAAPPTGICRYYSGLLYTLGPAEQRRAVRDLRAQGAVSTEKPRSAPEHLCFGMYSLPLIRLEVQKLGFRSDFSFRCAPHSLKRKEEGTIAGKLDSCIFNE